MLNAWIQFILLMHCVRQSDGAREWIHSTQWNMNDFESHIWHGVRTTWFRCLKIAFLMETGATQRGALKWNQMMARRLSFVADKVPSTSNQSFRNCQLAMHVSDGNGVRQVKLTYQIKFEFFGSEPSTFLIKNKLNGYNCRYLIDRVDTNALDCNTRKWDPIRLGTLVCVSVRSHNVDRAIAIDGRQSHADPRHRLHILAPIHNWSFGHRTLFHVRPLGTVSVSGALSIFWPTHRSIDTYCCSWWCCCCCLFGHRHRSWPSSMRHCRNNSKRNLIRARSRRHTLSSDCTDADGIVGVGVGVDLMRLMGRQCWPPSPSSSSSMMLFDWHVNPIVVSVFDSVSVERTWGNIKCIGSIYLLYSHYHLSDDNSSVDSVGVDFVRFRCELRFFRSYHKSPPVLQRFDKIDVENVCAFPRFKWFVVQLLNWIFGVIGFIRFFCFVFFFILFSPLHSRTLVTRFSFVFYSRSSSRLEDMQNQNLQKYNSNHKIHGYECICDT